MKNVSFPEADVKAKQPRGICKARCDALQRLFCVGDVGRDIHKKNVPEKPFLGLGGTVH